LTFDLPSGRRAYSQSLKGIADYDRSEKSFYCQAKNAIRCQQKAHGPTTSSQPRIKNISDENPVSLTVVMTKRFHEECPARRHARASMVVVFSGTKMSALMLLITLGFRASGFTRSVATARSPFRLRVS